MIKFKCDKACLYNKKFHKNGKIVVKAVQIEKDTVIEVDEKELETNKALKHFTCLEPDKLPKTADKNAEQEKNSEQEKSSSEEDKQQDESEKRKKNKDK